MDKNDFNATNTGRHQDTMVRTLQLNEEVFEQKNWKTIIKQAGMRWENRNFRDYRTKSTTLQWYPKNNWTIRAWNVDGTIEGRNFSCLKLGDIGKWENQGKKCPLCDTITSDILKHMFLECEEGASNTALINSSRGSKILPLKTEENLKRYIASVDRQSIVEISKMINKWRRSREK